MRARPDVLLHFGFGHQAAGMRRQIAQHRQRARAYGNQLVAAPQAPLGRLQSEGAKGELVLLGHSASSLIWQESAHWLGYTPRRSETLGAVLVDVAASVRHRAITPTASPPSVCQGSPPPLRPWRILWNPWMVYTSERSPVCFRSRNNLSRSVSISAAM